MAVLMTVVVGLLVRVTMVLDAWLRRRHHPDLAERLRPFQAGLSWDEAQEWLQHQ